MAENSDIAINFNSYDFFYVKAGDKMPGDYECKTKYKIVSDSLCNHFPTISELYLKEIEKCNHTHPNNVMNCLSEIDYTNNYRTTYVKDYENWIIWNDNSYNCYKKELCLNKEKADEIKKIQEDHLGSEQNYINSKLSYKNELWKTGNLTMGIIGLIILIYYT